MQGNEEYLNNNSKIFPGSKEPTNLTKYNPGAAFGELALLYNAPRAATIKQNLYIELKYFNIIFLTLY